MIRSLVRKRHAAPGADRMLRVSGAIGLLAIPLAASVPGAAELVMFVLITIWLHGPASPLFPGTYEPTLLLYGQFFSPVAVAVIGALGCLWVEWINYHLHQSVLRTAALARFRVAIQGGRFFKVFTRWPFFAVWFCILSPLPDWIVRILAPLSGYPIGRYLAAGALANLLRFWLVAALGARWRPDSTQLGWIFVVSTTVGIALLATRLLRGRRLAAVPAPVIAPIPG